MFPFIRARFRRASEDLVGVATKHVPGLAVSLVATALGLPFVRYIAGVDMSEEAWLLVAYGVLGPLALVVVAFVVFYVRAGGKLYADTMSASNAPKAPEPMGLDPVPIKEGSVFIADMRIDTHRIYEPAAWMEFHCIGFNGSPQYLSLKDASGRIKFMGAEFHQKLELEQETTEIMPYSLFTFSVRLPLSTSEVGHFRDFDTDDHFVIIFKNAAVSVSASNSYPIALHFLPKVQFRRHRGEASPTYPTQLLQQSRER